MSASDMEHIGFEIEKEVWNRYELVDGAELRARAIILKIIKRKNPQNPTQMQIGGETKTLTSIIPMKGYKLVGTPSDKEYTPQELMSSNLIEVGFNQLDEDWNIYRLEDGSKLKVKMVVTNVKRSDKYDKHGLPIYNVQSTIVVNITPKPTQQ